MKKTICILTIMMCLLGFSTPTYAESDVLYFEDLTTQNFIKRSDELDFHAIKKICSYDYCEFITGDNMKEALEHFTIGYLKTIPDEEIRATLKVKGIRITKIVLRN